MKIFDLTGPFSNVGDKVHVCVKEKAHAQCATSYRKGGLCLRQTWSCPLPDILWGTLERMKGKQARRVAHRAP